MAARAKINAAGFADCHRLRRSPTFQSVLREIATQAKLKFTNERFVQIVDLMKEQHNKRYLKPKEVKAITEGGLDDASGGPSSVGSGLID